MAKYLKKLVTEETTGNQAECFIALELVTNLIARTAHVKEGGWKNGQFLADGKDQAISPILWMEPDIDVLLTGQSYDPGVAVEAILFDVIGYRMITLDDLPDGSGPNPFKGGTFEDIPDPS
jgi:hypothetical protein